MLRTRKQRIFAVIALVGLLGLLALAYDTNWLKPPIERMVTARTGREFRIDGDFRLRPGWPTRVHVERVRFANPSWAVEEQMLQLEQADIRIALWKLLFGAIVIPQAHASKPVVNLELGPERRNNWTLGATDDGRGGTVPVIGLLSIDQGVLRFHDPAERTTLTARASTTTNAKGGAQGIKFAIAGKLRNLPARIEGTGGPILSIKDRDTPYPFGLVFAVGPSRGRAKGRITGLSDLVAADIRLDVHGQSLDEVFPLLGIALPPTPPYRIKGRLLREGDFWRMHDFAGRVGDSDLSGDVDVQYRDSDQRPYVAAKVTSRVVDLDDFAGIIGAPPQTGAGETASPRQRQEAEALSEDTRLLPREPYKLERLRAMDADIRFTGKSIRGRRLPFDDIDAHIKLEHGVLRASPLNFGVAGGKVASSLTADARRDPLAVDTRLQFKRLQLRQLFPESELMKDSQGLIGGRANLRTRGNDFAGLMASADGSLGMAMRGGRVSNLMLEFTGLDVAEITKFLFAGDRNVHIRCAVADVSLEDGLMRTRSVVLDTTDTNISLDGTVNFKNEALDLTVHPLPKDWSPLVLRAPLHLRGSLKQPDIQPDKKILLRGGAAAVLGALAGPLAALLPLIETGQGEDADCEALAKAAEQNSQARVQPSAGALSRNRSAETPRPSPSAPGPARG